MARQSTFIAPAVCSVSPCDSSTAIRFRSCDGSRRLLHCIELFDSIRMAVELRPLVTTALWRRKVIPDQYPISVAMHEYHCDHFDKAPFNSVAVVVRNARISRPRPSLDFCHQWRLLLWLVFLLGLSSFSIVREQCPILHCYTWREV